MNRELQYLILVADLVWIIGVSSFTHWVRKGSADNLYGFSQWVLVLAALFFWSALYMSKKLDCFRGGWHFPRVCAQLTVAVFYLMAALTALAFALRWSYGAPELLEVGCLLPIGFISIRCLVRWSVDSQSNTGAKRRVIIVGSGRIARELAAKIARHPETSMEVAGLLSPSDVDLAKTDSGLSSGTVSIRTLDILTLMQKERVRELIIVEPLPVGVEAAKLIATCRNRGMRVHLVPQRYELYVSKARLDEIDGIPLLSLEQQTLPALGMELKRRLDIVGAGILLILVAPLFAFLAVGLFMSKGKVFQKERRCGKGACPFWMHRLNVDRDAAHLPAFERFLAQCSLTELPQLWNVLRGEMSLVGPRPESPDRVKHYSTWQRERLNVTPGLTGLAQVHGLRERHSSEEKARFDLQYISQWSLFLDLSLLVQTVWILLVRLSEHDAFRVASESQRSPIANP